ncbi:hypothetical protein N7509_008834 [Penicillium cosmopolitanum]|uniref:FAD-binding PCMH-type domain-containing protein n=1 Tax=Penicillium cosmopolitanum TaxID=1131564 RepID=A0A9W9VNA0_9EURO|nr:uncharacterized protein N7509_008834 [Penicillium cosmopolitanum]KAJ5386293.1 hypothetical protein N7509_008834 [Penicillium cosmopolitanum]
MNVQVFYWKIQVLYFSFLLLSAAAIVVPEPQHSSCRCRPHENCWPTQQQWSTLNSTIQGNLVAVRPVASVCHAMEYDAKTCNATTELWTNSVWRSAQPGAGQWENWEAWPEHHETCYIEAPRNSKCGQGRISLYSAKVQTKFHVQKAVLFAKSHNLRLAIKNTGHDFLGRSTAPESLQILTHEMKDIKVVEDFSPKGAPNRKSEGPAVTMSAGVQLPELYLAVAKHNRTVIAGSSHTVGAAGGYIQGGGHSPFGAWKGLASDNAIEFEVVTANGTIATANSYQNSDLFWALRGGGGGTFGVVTSATAPVVVYNFNITTTGGDPRFWDAFSAFHAALPSLNDARGSGYYFGLPNLPIDQNTTVSTIISLLMFPEKTDVNEIAKLYEPLKTKLKNIGGVKVDSMPIPFPSVNSTIFTILLAGSDTDSTGSLSALLVSRLFSRDLMLSDRGLERLTKAWKSIRWDPFSSFTGHVVAGPAVAANKNIDSAVNPAWRKTVSHMLFGRGWNTNTTLAQQKAMVKNMTDVEIPILRSVEGEDQMGAYVNEANGYEPGFQKAFWGENYHLLYKIKQKWDPKGLFISRKGVGSEDWDDAGLCKVKA